ncbi:hypothetical protein CPB84DRAFT_1843537 [Gymnopilus junonius]|uniref:Chitinase n=1 Tax=Gymnopilus junonius TaxID=109634 RepID=A0A9P5NYF3_GYMJU|nr:hypothetical protein CPB84DRAFT_1843537 [Gymnopilus junonius]
MRGFISALSAFISLLAFNTFFIARNVTAQTGGSVPTNATNLPTGTCTPDIPCANAACCDGTTGLCGFGPSFCGAGICTSNCDAKAECGPFADASNFTCPLSVCCSQFGFCGTTDDFCGEGCQSNCGGPKIPSCDVGTSTATARRIGYYEGWAVNRKCMSYEPEQIAADTLTHINFAFALISSSFQVIEMSPGDSDLWRRTTALKEGRPALKVFLSIGGWTFNDPPTQNIFSDMVASTANTNTFIKSILSVMETYAFDGIDIDWEYPGAWDRGGVLADTENYVTFMEAVKTAFASRKYGLTFTAPSSFWYLQHFDLPGLLKHADWVNVMTYDLHGTWDGVDWGMCCTNPLPYGNCEWKGTPPLCDDNACDVGQITILSDFQGDASRPCAGGAQRTYCCDPPVDLPAPFSDIFPSGVPDSGNDLFHVDLDPDQGSTGSESGTKSTFTETDNEDSGAFGEVFIDSPKPSSVSSLNLQSDWVAAYCSVANSASCKHVFIGGAENTIVELPKSCGLGPYARVVSLDVHLNQSILSQAHQKAKPTSEDVYLLHFDYNFAAIPESNGPIYMRADVTDMPGYWDSVVDSPPERRQWLEERGLWKEPKQKRWWGAFTSWLSKITQLEVDKSQTRSFFWSDTWNIFHQDSHCDGPPQFDSSLDISLTGTANMQARYGFYLQGTVVPPAVTAAYVHFSSDASASATFTVKGEASVQYNSNTVTFATFGFPGLYYPGLLTVGPSLVLDGYIAGQLTVQGQLTTGLTYQFPSINYALGKTGDDVIGPAANPGPPSQGYDYSFGLNVDLSGDVTVHIVPTIQLGISVLNGQLIEADAYISADLYAGVAINGSVSLTSALEVCVIPHYGLIVQGGIQGNVLYWETSTTPFTFYDRDFVYADKCFSSVQEPSGSSSSRRSLLRIEGSSGETPHHGTPTRRGARIIETVGIDQREILPLGTLDKRQTSAPSCPGLLSCPNVDSEIGQDNTDNDIYSDYPGNIDTDEVYRRDFDDFSFENPVNLNLSLVVGPEPSVTVASCSSIKFDPFPYNNIGVNYYNLASPTSLDGTLKVYSTSVGYVNTNTYNREHPHNILVVSDFINTLAQSPALWQNAAGNANFCKWAQTNLNSPSNYAVPSNTKSSLTGGGKQMPWLESTANGIKARAFSGTALRTSSTFRRYSYSKKVFVIRAAAGLVSYMSDGPVADQFVQVSDCVQSVWSDFYNAYNADNTLDAPNKGNFNPVSTYHTYITMKVQNFFLNLRSGVNQMIGFYSASAGSDSTQKNVDLNYGKLSANPMTATSADDLTNSIFNPLSTSTLVKLTLRL